MKSRPTSYPDISDILARKAAGRRLLASLSFGEKLDMLDAMRARVAPLQRARALRRRKQAAATEAAPAYAAARQRRRKAPKK